MELQLQPQSFLGASQVAQLVKNLPAMPETWVQSLVQEYPMQKGMATHTSILTWRISWTEEPGRLQFMGSQRVRHTLGLHNPDNHDGVITHLEPDTWNAKSSGP